MEKAIKKVIGCISCLFILISLGSCAKDEVETMGTIYGIVNDADNGEPVGDAHVSLNPGGKTTNTGSDGRYEFMDMDPGQYTIQISKTGHKTNTKRITVVAGEQASGDMILSRGESRIRLNTGALEFGNPSTSKTFTIMNVGTSGSVSWSVNSFDSWLSITPTSGSTAQGKNSTVVVNIDRSKITKDISSNLIVQADGESIPVEISVTTTGNVEGGGGGSCGTITSCDSKVAVEFVECVKFGNVVEFQFTVTNKSEDLQIWFRMSNSVCVDDKGNTYQGLNNPFYVSNKQLTDGNPHTFLKNVPTKCKISIPGVGSDASYLKRYDVAIYTTTPWTPQLNKITLEDIKW